MTEQESIPRTKVELLERIKSTYNQLLEAVQLLNDQDLGGRVEADGWTVKDNLAHIAAWEDVLIRHHFQGEPFAQIVGIESAHYWRTSEDEVNASFYARYRDWSAEQVHSFFSETHRALMQILESLPEERLHAPPEHFRGDPDLQHPLIDFIAGNTYDHYEEHLDSIQKILDQSND